MKTISSKLIISLLGLCLYSFLAAGSWSNKPKDKLEFVGHVQTDKGKPLNNRLVIVYLNSKEVGRGRTYLGHYHLFEEYPSDGLFHIAIPNEYKLRKREMGSQFPVKSQSRLKSVWKLRLGSVSALNLGELYENGWKTFDVKARPDVQYTVKVLPGEFEALPLALQDEKNITILDKNGKVVVFGPEGMPKTDPTLVKFINKKEEVKLKEIEFPLNNCGGNSAVHQSYYKTESFLHETSFNLTADAKARFPWLMLGGLNLSSHLKAEFDFNHREMSEETISADFSAKPRSHVIYKIIWYEIWQHGMATVPTEDGPVTLPFKVKTQLKYKIETKKGRCG